ncbi:Mating-type switching protein swi10 [Tolypocladium paradoxum]|uniref:Mating-type switching protein swi10 n=1 Tax=Tolypocladium paradoxum TaxID=94208 RepID=A0A2S4L4J3_9HYPO|nr:Mating-type switching protein swi10 [Tolypocladium paradoxum]
MEDDYGADDALLAAMAAADPAQAARRTVQQPAPQRIQQPTPQRLDRAPPANSSGSRVVQPTPQALPQKQSVSSILVSPRQRGNPVLTCIRSMPWEYSDIPADYVLGLTTCALFLSLKYHRLHPEYIYTRIRNLQGKYNLRVLLTMVDIPNHEDSLRELSKTSLVNNVTIILCWSAAETARYIELYKSYENANFAAIRGQQSSSYADKLVDFVTVPRNLNKSDAVALVANFGSLKNAINAETEQLGMLNGWGGVKVKRWSAAIDEPFRAKKAAKRNLQTSTAGGQRASGSQNADRVSRLEQAVPLSRVPLRDMPSLGVSSREAPARSTPGQGTPSGAAPEQFQFLDDMDGEAAMLAAAIEESKKTAQPGGGGPSQLGRMPEAGDALSGGVAAALAKLRENG